MSTVGRALPLSEWIGGGGRKAVRRLHDGVAHGRLDVGVGPRGAVAHQYQKRRRRAECPPGDAVVAGPGAVGVLHALEVLGHPPVPVLPLLATLAQQRLADVQVAKELLAAVGAEAADKRGALELLVLVAHVGVVVGLHLVKVIDLLLRLHRLRRRQLAGRQGALQGHLLGQVAIDRLLPRPQVAGGAVQRHARRAVHAVGLRAAVVLAREFFSAPAAPRRTPWRRAARRGRGRPTPARNRPPAPSRGGSRCRRPAGAARSWR